MAKSPSQPQQGGSTSQQQGDTPAKPQQQQQGQQPAQAPGKPIFRDWASI